MSFWWGCVLLFWLNFIPYDSDATQHPEIWTRAATVQSVFLVHNFKMAVVVNVIRLRHLFFTELTDRYILSGVAKLWNPLWEVATHTFFLTLDNLDPLSADPLKTGFLRLKCSLPVLSGYDGFHWDDVIVMLMKNFNSYVESADQIWTFSNVFRVKYCQVCLNHLRCWVFQQLDGIYFLALTFGLFDIQLLGLHLPTILVHYSSTSSPMSRDSRQTSASGFFKNWTGF